MVFSSLEFIFRFLPIFFLAYFATPARYRNIVLVVGSLVFYAVGEPVYIFLMMASILLNYVLAIGISDSRGRGRAGMLLAVGLAVDLGLLFFFKYLNFFVENICAVTGFKAHTIDVALPLGISFYTLDYVIYNRCIQKKVSCRQESDRSSCIYKHVSTAHRRTYRDLRRGTAEAEGEKNKSCKY